MLAGRKLLLADDSVTIQKVVDLTFADEGVEVIAVGSGTEAIERLEEIAPDVVLADVFMPGKNGYEVCEHIKGSEKWSRLPVMLLVGSFEPFDEAEARRVGADDILTKPFQSIRRLIDRVGELVTGKLDDNQTATADLSHVVMEDAQALNSEELKATRSADTQPLHESLPAEIFAHQPVQQSPAPENSSASGANELADSGDVLLELDDLAPVRQAADDEFVLDIDVDDVPTYDATSLYADSIESPSYPEQTELDGNRTLADAETAHMQDIVTSPAVLDETVAGVTPEPAPVAEAPMPVAESLAATSDEPQSAAATPGEQITLEQLSPEVIDAIAKRAVEQLSEKAIQEIAWEVVPQLAELLIKRQLQEKESPAH